MKTKGRNKKKLNVTIFASRFVDQELESAGIAIEFIDYIPGEFDVQEICSRLKDSAMNSEVLHEQTGMLHGQTWRPLKTTAAWEKQYGKQPQGIKEVKRVKMRNSTNKHRIANGCCSWKLKQTTQNNERYEKQSNRNEFDEETDKLNTSANSKTINIKTATMKSGMARRWNKEEIRTNENWKIGSIKTPRSQENWLRKSSLHYTYNNIIQN